MPDVLATFLDQTEVDEVTSPVWPALKVSRGQIEAEVARLAALAQPADGDVRRSLIVHPNSRFRSLTPTIRVGIEVVLPGEKTAPTTRSSSSVELCIGGTGIVEVDGSRFETSKHDTWTVPNLTAKWYEATGDEPYVRLVFSDAPLLEYLAAHYVNDDYRAAVDSESGHEREPMADFVYEMPSGGGALKTYAGLMDPEVVRHRPKCWKWTEVKAYLDGLDKSGPDYRSAIIALLWDDATGRVNGSTNTLTAFISGGFDPTWVEGKYRMARSHRHSMAAINYAFAGDWQTVVEGKKIRWSAGDLVLTAPAWALHTNGSCSQQPYTFAMQDAALVASMNASVVQEYVGQQPILIGSHSGFNTSIDTEHADELVDL
ncbi:gentisate 1,2-dioxygenase [Rhodococcus sp. ABRD24]|uniref:gentisate 1,2-dioxygenase n=1 Tax=Rhodococcus sp. ABRD24 TaxID=2507582 RepID=UPI00103AE09E|nr:gentisate 1,2-dioxygenase [Rhodococcus sp. ABRD24]QBJ97753.1 gentisate 1,2-dioxygenase [Rhodococcus sp. ABRD24]